MDRHVGLQNAGPGEGLAALIAHKWSLVGVDPLVLLPAHHGEVATIAVATGERGLQGVMGEIVCLQLTRYQKGLWALPEKYILQILYKEKEFTYICMYVGTMYANQIVIMDQIRRDKDKDDGPI